MVSDPRLNYLVSNGEYCIMFLESLARGEPIEINRNEILNHALSVSSVLRELRIALNQNAALEKHLSECRKELREIKSGEVDNAVQKRFEELKDSLISYIQCFD